jgi:cold shock CspA family protein
MPLTGTLRTWHDDRGFGFIAPTHGGRELFVHISAFPRDGSRPTVGETLSYELGRGKDGQPQAVRVYRQALGRPGEYPRTNLRATPRARSSANGSRRSRLGPAMLVVLALTAGAFAYNRFERTVRPTSPSPAMQALPSVPSTVAAPVAPAAPPSSFRCDGRTRCSQMTSCAEATFFLKNCPNTKMDGNGDGVPCEQQWCR